MKDLVFSIRLAYDLHFHKFPLIAEEACAPCTTVQSRIAFRIRAKTQRRKKHEFRRLRSVSESSLHENGIHNSIGVFMRFFLVKKSIKTKTCGFQHSFTATIVCSFTWLFSSTVKPVWNKFRDKLRNKIRGTRKSGSSNWSQNTLRV